MSRASLVLHKQGTQSWSLNNPEGWNGREVGGRLGMGHVPVADSCQNVAIKPPQYCKVIDLLNQNK